MKAFAKGLIRRFGYEVRRYAPTSSESAQLAKILKYHGVDVVFDVGANTGGYGRYLRGIGYRGKIVSFEPMSDAYKNLILSARRDKHWTVARRSAIGAQDGEIHINVAGNSESSSILSMLEAHTVAAPDSSYVGGEIVPISRLDSIASDYLDKSSKLFLKVDTQGYEQQVLEGGELTISGAVVIQMELSLVPLYSGQCLMPALIDMMEKRGFALWGFFPVFADPRSGRMLQMDGIFSRLA